MLMFSNHINGGVMKRIGQQNEGYSAVEIILLIVIVAIIGFVALYVRSASLSTAHTYNTATADSNSPAPIKKSKKITSSATTSKTSTTSSKP